LIYFDINWKKEDTMKKVLPVRIPVYINAKLVSDGKNYDGIIGNLSQTGAFVETVPTRTIDSFTPHKKLELHFQTTARKTLILNCAVVWLYTKRNIPDHFANSMGIEIIDPPAAYKKYFKTL
jgi:hypothetical protein